MNYRKQLDRLQQRHELATQQVEQEQEQLEEAKQHTETVLSAQQILQSLAEQIQRQAHQQIARLVTRCLQAVFGEDSYEFQIVFEKKRGKTEAYLLLVRDGK